MQKSNYLINKKPRSELKTQIFALIFTSHEKRKWWLEIDEKNDDGFDKCQPLRYEPVEHLNNYLLFQNTTVEGIAEQVLEKHLAVAMNELVLLSLEEEPGPMLKHELDKVTNDGHAIWRPAFLPTVIQSDAINQGSRNVDKFSY